MGLSSQRLWTGAKTTCKASEGPECGMGDTSASEQSVWARVCPIVGWRVRRVLWRATRAQRFAVFDFFHEFDPVPIGQFTDGFLVRS